MKKTILCCVLLLGVLLSCEELHVGTGVPTLPDTPYDYTMPIEAAVMFGNLPSYTNASVTLGRVLFYDKRLSLNQTTSCASCHHQHLAFGDDKAFSTGVNIITTDRNSPSFSNLYTHRSKFFWGGENISLNALAFIPIKNHVEMRFSEEGVLERLYETDFYPALFEEAYGSPLISKDRVERALGDFMASMLSINSKYDRVQNGEESYSFSEARGEELFFGKAGCDSCHKDENFFNNGWRANIGLDIEYADNGAGSGNFKIPSLRNIGLSAPYMHDGRFKTLREVIDHYNEGVQPHEYLDWRLTKEGMDGGTPRQLDLTESEVRDLEAFLHTLTDWDFVTDERFSDPF